MEIKTIKSVEPFIENGKHKTIKNPKTNTILYQNIVTFTDGQTGPVFTVNPDAPYDEGDQVETIRNENKAGKHYYSIKKTSPFPKEETSNVQQSTTEIKVDSLRETHIAIAAVDKALNVYNIIKPKDDFILDEKGVEQITEIAIDLTKIITKVEKNVF
jgi:hypothetical protein